MSLHPFILDKTAIHGYGGLKMTSYIFATFCKWNLNAIFEILKIYKRGIRFPFPFYKHKADKYFFITPVKPTIGPTG